jgi:charged multivesicular body protein 4A/B
MVPFHVFPRHQSVKKRLTSFPLAAAKAALRRKKVHERSLQQTNDQIAQVEQQIYSIEAANINQETLNAMKTAGKAMKDIHGNLTIDKVDATMYVQFLTTSNIFVLKGLLANF